jgi:hypothetical protein
MIFDLYNRCALTFYQIFCIPLQRTGIYLVYAEGSPRSIVLARTVIRWKRRRPRLLLSFGVSVIGDVF